MRAPQGGARLLLLLAAACAGAAPPPPMRVPGALDGREPTVRVLLRHGGPRTSVTVSCEGGLRVEADGRPLETARSLRVAASDGRLLLEGDASKAALLRIAPRTGLLAVDGRAYSGELRLRAAEGVEVINHVRMENYVLGVLRGELPLPEVPPEAAAAQAVAVRSYTLHYLRQSRPDWDVDDSILFQRYAGVLRVARDDDLRRGVQETRGLYLDCGGRPLKAYYHSTCGGHTTDPRSALGEEDAPPLHGVPCDACGASRYFRWEKRLDGALLARAAGLTGTTREVAVVERSAAARATRIRVRTDAGDRTLAAGEFRIRVGPSELRSTRIDEIRAEPGGFLFRGGGWGHGVGLCQMGAIGMAKAGSGHAAILERYYPGARLHRAY